VHCEVHIEQVTTTGQYVAFLVLNLTLDSSLNVMAHSDPREGN